MDRSSTRIVVTLVLVAALVFSAGCSGIGIGESNTDATDANEPTTSTDAQAGTGSDQTTNDGESKAANDEGSTATSTEESENGGSHDGHDHEHADESAGDDGANGGDAGDGTDEAGTTDGDAEESEGATEEETGELNDSSAAASGRVRIAVNGTELDLAARDESGDEFAINDTHGDEWLSAEADLTLAEALSTFGIDATSSELTVDGETFSERDNGTTITYRVDEEPVDPEEYELQTWDQIWITVETAEMNVSSPGTYIKEDQYHAHGDMTFIVDGHEVNFTKKYYQTDNHRFFHYEGGSAYWHAHSWSITLEDALSALSGINAEGDSIYYNGTSYDDSDEGTSIDVTVNGEPVVPDQYFLKDGDSVRVVIESEA